jgi:MFS family permease
MLRGMSAITQRPPLAERTPAAPASSGPRSRAHGVGFWLAALAFFLNMSYSAVPTPLYVLYQRRDGFGSLMITVIFAVYALGVIVSLFLGGHLSDWLGRRRVLIPALLLNASTALIFIFVPSVAGLLIARVLSGFAIGLTTATATSYVSELHARHRPGAGTRRADVVATAANLGGISFGPLAAGFIAQFLPSPLHLSYVVFGGALVLVALALTLAPETVRRPEPRPRYRPQRVAVPESARATFFAATAVGFATFAVLGVFNSLAPSFIAGTLHYTSHATAGIGAFTAIFAAALAQIFLARLPIRTLLRAGVPLIIVGLALIAGAMWVPSLALFIVGGLLAGAGTGMAFKGALVTAATSAPAQARAEVLAGFFLGSYVGLALPAIGLGVATTYWAAKDVMLVFAAIVAVAVTLAVRAATTMPRNADGLHLPPADPAPGRPVGEGRDAHQRP